MTTTMTVMKTIIDITKEQGMRDKVTMMVGGAPITAEFAAEIAPLVDLEDVDARPYCMVPIELSPFANLTDGERAVFGVSDATMTNAFASVPADERKICLPVVGRGITAAEAIYNPRAYLAWDEDGETRTLAEIGDEDPALKASYYGHAIDDLAKWLQARQ